MTGSRQTATVLLAALILGVYGYRAVTGVVGGIAYAKGDPLAATGDYERALPHLERAAVGFNRLEALWLRAEVNIGILDRRVATGEEPVEADLLLTRAADDYITGLLVAPASAWPWAGLATLFDRVERGARANRAVDLSRLGEGPWAGIGVPGRSAVGSLRLAIEQAPNVLRLRDQLTLTLDDYGLTEAAIEAMRESARVQPAFHVHAYNYVRDLPSELLEAFAESSKEALGKTPFMSEVQHLLAIGRLERRLGRLDEAELHLRRALELPAASLNRAEGHFHLGSVLFRKGGYEEARVHLEEARTHETFQRQALYALARLARAEGNLDEALTRLRQLRWIDPTNLTYCLEFARVARELERWDEALEALKWASVVHESDLGPRIELARFYLETGDVAGARSIVVELRAEAPENPEVADLRGRLLDAGVMIE